MDLFIGFDVSLATAICVVNVHGKVVKEAKVASEPEALAEFCAACRQAWSRLALPVLCHKGLTDAGLEVALMGPGR